VHFEIGGRDRAVLRRFYSSLFGWNIEPQEHSDVISTGSTEGINGHTTSLGHEPHTYTMFYVRVADLDACVANCESLGGSRLVGPVDIPEGRFAWLTDPEGNTVGVLESAVGDAGAPS